MRESKRLNLPLNRSKNQNITFMDALKINTLEQIRDALEIIEDARDDSSLTPMEKSGLEKAAVQLRNIERSIIRKKEQELVASLTDDSMALKGLVVQIRGSAKKLAAVANAIEKTSKVVEAVIKAAKGASSAGLL